MMNHKKSTDWDSYYKKTFKIAFFSRLLSGNILINEIKSYSSYTRKLRIAELGGANSCFYDKIRKNFDLSSYKIIDNNKFGLNRFSDRVDRDLILSLDCQDVLDINKNQSELYHVVFSVGLIEHFSPVDTAKAISAHFNLLEQNGICIITFPTPTWLYKLSRKISEMLRLWIFWDERPLTFNEVEQEINKYGNIVHKALNWPIFFTQGIIVAKKK